MRERGRMIGTISSYSCLANSRLFFLTDGKAIVTRRFVLFCCTMYRESVHPMHGFYGRLWMMLRPCVSIGVKRRGWSLFPWLRFVGRLRVCTVEYKFHAIRL